MLTLAGQKILKACCPAEFVDRKAKHAAAAEKPRVALHRTGHVAVPDLGVHGPRGPWPRASHQYSVSHRTLVEASRTVILVTKRDRSKEISTAAILLAVHLARTTIEPLQRVSDKYRPTGSDQQEDLATLGSVQLRQTLAL